MRVEMAEDDRYGKVMAAVSNVGAPLCWRSMAQRHRDRRRARIFRRGVECGRLGPPGLDVEQQNTVEELNTELNTLETLSKMEELSNVEEELNTELNTLA